MPYMYTNTVVSMGAMGYSLSPTTYPLDDVSGAKGGWSTRLIRAAYAGACLKVRRSSDNATQDIGFIGQLIDYSSLLAFTGMGNGFVDTWYDQSGNGYDVVQASTILQPQIVASGVLYDDLGNYPAIDFTARYLETSVGEDNLLSTTAGTVFALWKADTAISTGDGNTIWCNRGGWNGTFIKTISGTPNIRIFGFDGDEDFITTSGFAVATPYVTAWKHDTGTLYSYVNGGTAVGSVAHGTESTITAHFCIGRDSQTAATSAVFDGRIMEVICYNTALSSGNTNTVGADIASPFGVPWS